MQDFVTSMFQRGAISQEAIDQFTSPKSLRIFEQAFTSEKVDPKNNYDLYEHWGDPLINSFVTYYILHRFPQITNTSWINKLQHNLKGKEFLSKLSKTHGFDRQLVKPFRLQNILRNPDSIEYKSLLEDVFESFFGAMMVVIMDSKSWGVGIQIVYTVLEDIYNEVSLSIKYEDVFDATSRLKELYETKGYLSWGNFTSVQKTRFENHKYFTKTYGWPKGDKSQIPKNMVLLSDVYGKTKEESKEKSADEAIRVLREKYNIFVEPKPYT